MRIAYLDESGTGNQAKEPHVVVAGLVVEPDIQWRTMDTYLKDMANDFALPQDREDFIFHATDLASGGKGGFRDRYPEEKRHWFLRELCSMPLRFDCPVVMHSVERGRIRKNRPEHTEDQLITEGLQHASLGCAVSVERYMQKTFPNEVAMVVYEQNGQKSAAMRDYHNLFHHSFMEEYLEKNPDSRLLKFDRVIDTAHFARKADTSMLQVADAAVHVFSRKLRGAAVNAENFSHLGRQLISWPKIWRGELMAIKESPMPVFD